MVDQALGDPKAARDLGKWGEIEDGRAEVGLRAIVEAAVDDLASPIERSLVLDELTS